MRFTPRPALLQGGGDPGVRGTLADRLESRKAVDRAKGLLQEHEGMTEAAAFRWIQKTAMQRRVTMRVVAGQVIERYISM